jgi:hypothetical protein
LSDLFLDTELSEDDYRKIAAVLHSSGYSLEELRGILFDEVGPAFAFNMMDIAGEWYSWDANEVREIMCRSLERSTVGKWAKRKWFGRYVADMWSKLEPRITPT